MTKAKAPAHIAALQTEIADLRSVRIPQQEERTAALEAQYAKATPHARTLVSGPVFNGDPGLFTTLPTARAHLLVLRSQLAGLERDLEQAQAEANADVRVKTLEGERAPLSNDLTTTRRDIAASRARLAELEAGERDALATLAREQDKEAEALLDGTATDPDTVPKAERAQALARRMVDKLRERIAQMEVERGRLQSRIEDIDAEIASARLLIHRRAIAQHVGALIPTLVDACDIRFRMHGVWAAESEIPDLAYLVRMESKRREDLAT